MEMPRKTRKTKKNTCDVKYGTYEPRLRIALFTHDTFGLGHVRRSLNILHALSRRLPLSSFLLITGSPALSVLRDLPPNADVVKIPTVVKTGTAGSQPPHLRISVAETTVLRAGIIKQTVLAFAPDIFIVDNFPLGSQLELLPLLQALQSLPTKTIIGLRDILDTPDTVCTDWKRQGIYDVLERYYDKILIYGSQNVFDVVSNYRLSYRTAKKVRYCGYLTATEPIRKRPDTIRRLLGMDGHFILVTGGGGGDAFPLLNSYIEALPHLPDISSFIITGPLMGPSDRANLESKLNGNTQGIVMKDFVPDLSPYFRAADVVVTMCGYNTAAEIMVQNPKAIVVPRTWRYGEHVKRYRARNEGEQIMRAQALARSGFVTVIEPEQLQPEFLAQEVYSVLRRRKKTPRIKINVKGLETTVEEVLKTVIS
jgi:predicted glycosyltransferase